jgi:hypothetical protein
MLTNLLDRLGGLVSRQFVAGYFVPVLVFGFLNALLLGWQVKAFREWAPSQFEGFKGLYALPLLIGLSVLAYLILSVNVYLRQVLEGRRLVPAFLRRKLAEQERKRREKIQDRFQKARDETDSIQRLKPDWKMRTSAARKEGIAKKSPKAVYDKDSPTAKYLATLFKQMKRAEPPTRAAINEAVTAICSVLATIDCEGSSAPAQKQEQDYNNLLGLAAARRPQRIGDAVRASRSSSDSDGQHRSGSGQLRTDPLPDEPRNLLEPDAAGAAEQRKALERVA